MLLTPAQLETLCQLDRLPEMGCELRSVRGELVLRWIDSRGARMRMALDGDGTLTPPRSRRGVSYVLERATRGKGR